LVYPGEGGRIRLPQRRLPDQPIRSGELDVDTRAHPLPVATPTAPDGALGRSRVLRWLLSAWLVFHLTAIVVAPASVTPSSNLIQSTWLLFQPYLEALYLNNGYHFFAPEPAESTLVAFEARRADGTVIRGRIPDRKIVPRQLYHRHFMLTERMNNGPEELEQKWYRSYAEHIGHKYKANQVSLTRVIHYLPSMQMVRDGVRLNHPESYEELPLGDFACEP
jgi:hypothetical protein